MTGYLLRPAALLKLRWTKARLYLNCTNLRTSVLYSLDDYCLSFTAHKLIQEFVKLFR